MAINSGFSHQKWWFSMAMLGYQRVDFTISTGAFGDALPDPDKM